VRCRAHSSNSAARSLPSSAPRADVICHHRGHRGATHGGPDGISRTRRHHCRAEAVGSKRKGIGHLASSAELRGSAQHGGVSRTHYGEGSRLVRSAGLVIRFCFSDPSSSTESSIERARDRSASCNTSTVHIGGRRRPRRQSRIVSGRARPWSSAVVSRFIAVSGPSKRHARSKAVEGVLRRGAGCVRALQRWFR
jgi:hypothetical protein